MEQMIKGYIVAEAGRFILEDATVSVAVPRAVVEGIRRNAPSIKPSGWYPREDAVKLFRAIAASQPDEHAAREALYRCGEAIGGFAIGTFLKLLLKVLTPRMFANKFPDLFLRDHQGGHIEVGEVREKSLVLHLKDVAGFDHFGPISAGWARLTLRGMGLTNVEMKVIPWSLAEPGPTDQRFEATWT